MRASSKPVRVLVNGQIHEANSAVQGLLEILRYLASTDPTFLQRFALSAKGRIRKHLARERKDIYPDRPDLAQNAVEVSDGWFLGKNISNREKRQLVRKACEVASLKFGTEVDLICGESVPERSAAPVKVKARGPKKFVRQGQPKRSAKSTPS